MQPTPSVLPNVPIAAPVRSTSRVAPTRLTPDSSLERGKKRTKEKKLKALAAVSLDCGHSAHPTAANMTSCAPVPTLRPEERADLLSLLAAAARPLADVVADFLSQFPRERRLRVCATLGFLLEASRCRPLLLPCLPLSPRDPLAPPSLFLTHARGCLLRLVRLGGERIGAGWSCWV
jgi:hypothetical protein